MKQFLIVSNIIFVSLLIFMACNSAKMPAGTASSATMEKICYSCDNDAFNTLTVDELLTGISRYKHTHSDLIDKVKYMTGNGLVDSRACMYTLDTLKKFICLIENYSVKAGLDPHDLGIRFFYAVYDSKLPAAPDYRSHMTLFMVPTYKELDFDPRSTAQNSSQGYNEEINKSRSVKVRSEIIYMNSLPVNAKPLMIGLSGSEPSSVTGTNDPLAKNQGQLCPPRCPPKVEGTASSDGNSLMTEAQEKHPNTDYLQP